MNYYSRTLLSKVKGQRFVNGNDKIVKSFLNTSEFGFRNAPILKMIVVGLEDDLSSGPKVYKKSVESAGQFGSEAQALTQVSPFSQFGKFN
jgi:hypothetical protein